MCRGTGLERRTAQDQRERQVKLEQGMAAVVTGGASGLGKASAQALADAGLKVAIFDINDEDGRAHAEAIGGTFHHVDIMDEASVEAGFAAAERDIGSNEFCYGGAFSLADICIVMALGYMDRAFGGYDWRGKPAAVWMSSAAEVCS